ncbi:acyl-[acyl-carrier-protein] thioesterase [Aquiflexum lacus]|uniref:acyl-[acyl-carrier-protein] thioesterase n=1 Tax=Aquiflexum lacus TaxID=2483805 RepID=UPI00189428D2|nr:acyl-ACP thioesterase domain-containing protein [Aquiflexum lacus]
MSAKLPFQYEKKFEVLSFQIDPQGRIRLSALADLMQEVAWKHADSRDFGKALLEKGYVWVLSRFEIKIHHMPSWGDKIHVKTAGRGIDKLFALREFSITDERGNEIAEAMSAWLLVDINTKRPQRPGNVLPAELFVSIDDSGLMPEKIVLDQNLDLIDSIKVRPFDLDMNNHVNNVSYIRWVEDVSLNIGFEIKQILINYIAEARLEENIDMYLKRTVESILFSGRNVGKQVFNARLVGNWSSKKD